VATRVTVLKLITSPPLDADIAASDPVHVPLYRERSIFAGGEDGGGGRRDEEFG
tara:strand:+ start:1314 stop:1475 length:162 start_codon:yes stop_codon:yes gene_type:complete